MYKYIKLLGADRLIDVLCYEMSFRVLPCSFISCPVPAGQPHLCSGSAALCMCVHVMPCVFVGLYKSQHIHVEVALTSGGSD